MTDAPSVPRPLMAGVVLAAGAGRRFGQPKAPVVIDGERLVDRAVRNLMEGGCHKVVVVLGAWAGTVPEATVVINDSWETGIASSLQAGLAGLASDPHVDRAIVTLVDLPGLTPAAVRRVADSQSGLAVATYQGRPGHPVLLARNHWPAIVAGSTGDRGARDYLESRGDEVEHVEVSDVASGRDLDSPRDVAGPDNWSDQCGFDIDFTS